MQSLQSEPTPIVIPNYFASEQINGHSAQATFTSLSRFIEHVKQHATEQSVLFVQRDPDDPMIVAVFDYHERGADGCPRKRTERACYHFNYATSWLSWSHAHQCWMSPQEFGRFVKSRISDVVNPDRAGQLVKDFTAAERVQLATVEKLLRLSNDFETAIDVQSGQCAHAVSSSSSDMSSGDQHAEPLRIPGVFLLAMPVFREGATYQVGARISIDARERVKCSVTLWKMDEIVAHAIDDAWKTARRETGLPVIFGRPESQ